ncbi:MAG: hypothetical protein WC819_05680 [Parcubacteria group bacterium]
MAHAYGDEKKKIKTMIMNVLFGMLLVFAVAVVIGWLFFVGALLWQRVFDVAFLVLIVPPFMLWAIIGAGQEWSP